MSDTLILNADASPLTVVPISALNWQEAIKIYYLERADIVAYYDDRVVRSPSVELKVPAVMMLRDYIKPAKDIKFSRHNIFLRDNYVCQYCAQDFTHNKSALTLEHVIPRHHGGKTSWTNIVAACGACNVDKGHRLDYKKPMNAPRKPTYWELAEKSKTMPIRVPHTSWVPYLGWDENLVILQKNQPN